MLNGNNDAEIIAREFKKLQDHICQALELNAGEDLFIKDSWQRPGGGGGESRVVEGKTLFSRGGVNFSEVFGILPETSSLLIDSTEKNFKACGVSIVLHAQNPFVPTIHMNIRYFELGNGQFWFGGGIDLSPVYVIHEDGIYFHQALKNICGQFNTNWYERFKAWADDYFFLPHRNETRGIGGIFFDHLSESEAPKQELFNFCCQLATQFPVLYNELVNRQKDRVFDGKELEWQKLRRGRYVEFNLAFDRGTKFGLETNGRTESILMSLPETASWKYQFVPAPGSPEEQTQNYLVKNYPWL